MGREIVTAQSLFKTAKEEGGRNFHNSSVIHRLMPSQGET
jgi:hypothetical protein